MTDRQADAMTDGQTGRERDKESDTQAERSLAKARKRRMDKRDSITVLNKT